MVTYFRTNVINSEKRKKERKKRKNYSGKFITLPYSIVDWAKFMIIMVIRFCQ